MRRMSPQACWAVLISGRGSNMQALLDQMPNINIRWVLSSKADAPGLTRARRQGIDTSVLPKKIDWELLSRQLRDRGVTHIFLAGFMKIVPASFVDAWAGKILNVHPSLLPDYPGLNAMENSFREEAAMGVTVHVVTSAMDAGPRLLQRKISVASPRLPNHWPAVRSAMARTEHRLVREAGCRWK